MCVNTLVIVYACVFVDVLLHSMDKSLLPLGYHTSSQIIRDYAYKHGLQKVETTHGEETVDEAYVIFIACERANAGVVEWVASHADTTYLQISGGGGENEWRIAEDMENRLREEFGFMEEPVRFEPTNWMPPRIRIGRDPN
jgi:hypothetical protein